jgi:hypothetical protein
MRWAAMLALALLASALWAPGPAAAVPLPLPTITGLVKVEAPSVNNTAVFKSAVAVCPAGKRLINAGGYIVGGGGNVGMDDIYPDLTANSVTVTGKETDTLDTNWWVSAVATCADEPAGLELVWAVSTLTDSFPFKMAEANCTGNKTLLGSGATIKGGAGEAILDAIAPNGGPGIPATRVTVQAFESDTLNDDWEANAFAICADPLRGQQRLASSTVFASANDGARAECTNQVATGSGAEIVGVTGEVVIDNAYPIDGSATTAPTATTVYGQEEDATTGSWYITAFALCVDG